MSNDNDKELMDKFEIGVTKLCDVMSKAVAEFILDERNGFRQQEGDEVKLAIMTAFARGAGYLGRDLMTADDFLKMIQAQCHLPEVTIVQAAAEIVGGEALRVAPAVISRMEHGHAHNCESCDKESCPNHKKSANASKMN